MNRFTRHILVLAMALFSVLGLAPRHGLAAFSPGLPPTSFQQVSPFAVIGFMQKATLDSPNDMFSGGTVTVNGLLITIPRNTLFQFPATTMTWQEMFKLAPSPYGLGASGGPQSGLALADTPTPAMTYEITINGNRVIRSGTDDKYIAALVFLSQQSLNVGQGFVSSIDYAKGEIWVGSAPGAKTGARIRVNTPKGRFGRPDPTADPRFTSDEDNPTIRAETGYPMCVPRTDPAVADDALCPQHNRPGDPVTRAFATNYTMPSPFSRLDSEPDPTQQAPFEIGDYIDYSGTLVKDASGQYVSAHTIVANLGIFTYPQQMPAYVAVETMLLGVGGIPNPLFPQEAVEKLVMVAVSTDPSQLLDVYAVDVDACGVESNRFYSAASPLGPPVGGKRGRAVVRSTVGNYLPASREMRVATRTFSRGSIDTALANAQTYANGIIAGQYHAPNFEFIFPENLVYGGPPVAAPYEEFPFLVNGSGPYYGSGADQRPTPYGNLGQLSPWPGLQAPQPLGCGPAGVLKPPVANAGPAQNAHSGDTVILDGTASTDGNTPPLPLTYTWLQTGGPTVDLLDSGLGHPFFVAPTVTTPTALTFGLVVSNGYTTSAISNTTVTVIAQQNPVVDAGPDQSVLPLTTATLTGSATDPNGSAGKPLTFKWTQTAGPTVTLADSTKASTTFPAPALATGQGPLTLTFKLTVTDALGLSSSALTNVTVRPLPDVVQITVATWRSQKSRLTVTARSSTGNGVPVLTLHVAGQPDVIIPYTPSLGNGFYSVVTTANPAPSSITVTSSFGGSATSPVTITK